MRANIFRGGFFLGRRQALKAISNHSTNDRFIVSCVRPHGGENKCDEIVFASLPRVPIRDERVVVRTGGPFVQVFRAYRSG